MLLSRAEPRTSLPEPEGTKIFLSPGSGHKKYLAIVGINEIPCISIDVDLYQKKRGKGERNAECNKL